MQDKPLHPASFPPEDVQAVQEIHAVEGMGETGEARRRHKRSQRQ